jgi:hypothetical protein
MPGWVEPAFENGWIGWDSVGMKKKRLFAADKAVATLADGGDQFRI